MLLITRGNLKEKHMQKTSSIAICIIVAFTCYLTISLRQSSHDMFIYREATKQSLSDIEKRMDALDKSLDKAITSKQMSGHLIGVRTSLKEILTILRK